MATFIPPPLSVDGVTLSQSAQGILSIATAARPPTLVGSTGVAVTAGSTQFYGASGSQGANGLAEGLVEQIVSAPFTLTELYARNTSAAPANNAVLTIRKSGNNTALTVTIPAASAQNTLVSITGQAVAFAVGDRISMQITAGAGASSAYGWGVRGTGV